MFLLRCVCFGMISKLLGRGFRKTKSEGSSSFAAKFITSGCYWLGVRAVRPFADVCTDCICTVCKVNF